MIDPKTISISEVFDRICHEKTYEDQLKTARTFQTETLKQVFECAFHPAVIWEIPAGRPPFTPTQWGMSNLHFEVRRFSRFLRCSGMIGNVGAREKQFLDMLESLSAPEAEIVIMMKARRFSDKWSAITFKLAKALYPQSFPMEAPAESEIPFTEEPKTVSTEATTPLKRKPGRPKKQG